MLFTKHIISILFGGLILALLLSGCSVNPATGQQDLVLMSEDQELAIGRKTHAEIIKEYGIYPDTELAHYIQRVGDRVAAQSHRSNLIYRFTLLNTPEVNAFALPGGYIYITRGILAYLNTEDELAAVLGHEIGHVTARHAVRRHSTATVTSIAGAILAAASGVQGAGTAADLIGTAIVRGYGRDHELEADRLGAIYIAKSGYDPSAMMGVIKLLKNQELFEQELAKVEEREPRTYHGLFSTHPDNDQRLQSVIKAGDPLRNSPPGDKKSRQQFISMLDNMVFGENTDQGVIRGRNFYHIDMNFSLQFPEQWRIKNNKDNLTATTPANDGIIILTAHDRNRRITPQNFMRERLGFEDISSGESFTHHGMQGYTGLVKTETTFGYRIARIAVLYHGNQAFVIAGVSKAENDPYRYDSIFLKTAKSFRQLNDADRSLGLSRRIKTLAYNNTDYRILARSSGLNHLAESQIRLLNGHYPTGKPGRNELIKTIK